MKKNKNIYDHFTVLSIFLIGNYTRLSEEKYIPNIKMVPDRMM